MGLGEQLDCKKTAPRTASSLRLAFPRFAFRIHRTDLSPFLLSSLFLRWKPSELYAARPNFPFSPQSLEAWRPSFMSRILVVVAHSTGAWTNQREEMLCAVILASLLMSAAAWRPLAKAGGFMARRPLSMAVDEGQKVPSVVFQARVRDASLPGPNPFKWKGVSSEDLFKGKRVVLFSLPGGESRLKIPSSLFSPLHAR